MINYYLLTKPGIIMGNLVTLAAGFMLASREPFDIWLFISTLLGLSLVMASACVFNNYIDRQIDGKMTRTKQRALPMGHIAKGPALTFATSLAALGAYCLYSYTNLLTLAVAAFGFFVYVLLYSLWKCHTVYGTAIGSVAGAVPPVVGYCAVTGKLDGGALILFAIMLFWQMPHFFSIALLHLEDYVAAGIPVLPAEKGIARTKSHMLLYIVAFFFSVTLLTYFNYTGMLFLVLTGVFTTIWLVRCLRGFNLPDHTAWSRQMFRLSLLVILGLCLAIPLDRGMY